MSRRLGSLLLVVALAAACSPTSSPLARKLPSSSAASPTPAPSLSASRPAPSGVLLPSPRTIAGPSVAGAFDAATDGEVIAWSNGAVDTDAPELWRFDPVTAATALVYRSRARGAILANLAVRGGAFAFAEVSPTPDGGRTWRLVLLDATSSAHVLDSNDVPSGEEGILPMAAISDHGVLWAVSHAGDSSGPACELRYSSFQDLDARVVQSAPCGRTELWYPRSDGRSFVYGTVEYSADGATDERHVYLATDARPDTPRRLDTDGEAGLPAILGDFAVWKTAPRRLNMFSPGSIAALALSGDEIAGPVSFGADPRVHLITPTVGRRFVTAEDADGVRVRLWDRSNGRVLEVDRVAPDDPGFLSGTRLAGDLLIWFHTTSSSGGGTRELRWLDLSDIVTVGPAG